jgi:branched-chain amino acid transport system ATP-binding protein
MTTAMTVPDKSAAPLLEVESVSKRFGGFTALDSVHVSIYPGERFGLIGPNGSGKTTLINCISGSLRNDTGSILFAGEEIGKLPAYVRLRRGIARSFQIPRPFRSMTVLENLLIPIDFGGHGQTSRQAMDEVGVILDKMGLASKADVMSSQLSQVELRKMELARAMAARPKLLISDEAMAGLSSSEIDEVLDLLFKLNGEGITIIMIEHIMHAVMRFSQRIVCLEAGRIICEGTPQEVVGNARVQEAYLGA